MFEKMQQCTDAPHHAMLDIIQFLKYGLTVRFHILSLDKTMLVIYQ